MALCRRIAHSRYPNTTPPSQNNEFALSRQNPSGGGGGGGGQGEKVGGTEVVDKRGTRVNRGGSGRQREILEVIPQGLEK